MPRKRKSGGDNSEAFVKIAVAVVVLVAISMGGLHKIPEAIGIVVGGAIALSVLILGALYLVGYLQKRHQAGSGNWEIPEFPAPSEASKYTTFNVQSGTSKPQCFSNAESILEALREIDWYQFEKFCAVLLQSEGYDIERKGGAHPDGGVDLIATRDGVRSLIQCKHWKTWDIKEKIVREMLGSMAHFQVTAGAIYTLKGWTTPAAELAAQHQITLADGLQLASRAASVLPKDVLEEVLNCTVHHCPKCESPMVWRTGDFEPFWGCSKYPRCRGILRKGGAR